MAQLSDLVIDSAHPASLARFWAAALDGYQVAPYDEEAMADLAALGISDPEDDPSVLLEPQSGSGLRLFFNRVPEGKVVKNRLHVDLTATNPEAERTRLTGLGASLVSRAEDGWVVMADPEGNEFCLN